MDKLRLCNKIAQIDKYIGKPKKVIFFSGPATKGEGGLDKGLATKKRFFLRLPLPNDC